MILSQTYELKCYDVYLFDDCSQINDKWDYYNGIPTYITDNGHPCLKMANNALARPKNRITHKNNFICEMDIKIPSSWGGFSIGGANEYSSSANNFVCKHEGFVYYTPYTGDGTAYIKIKKPDSNWHHFKVTIIDNEISFYLDDILKGTATLQCDFSFYNFRGASDTNYQLVKNITWIEY